MSNYCILLTNKIKTFVEMQKAYDHNVRIKPVLNADPTQTDKNNILIPLLGLNIEEAFQKRIMSLDFYATGGKVRANAVLAIEVVTTFSREVVKEIIDKEWIKANIEWIIKTFNMDKSLNENVINMATNRDENGNFHIHSIIIPIDNKGRLNASYYIGTPQKLRSLQDSYAQAMKPFGLQRGIRHSVAKHEDIKRFYGELNEALSKELPPVQKNGLKRETAEEYRTRVNEMVKDISLAHLKKVKLLERKIAEARTYNLQAIIDTKREVLSKETRLEALEKLEREFGPVYLVREKLIEHEAMKKGINEFAIKRPELAVFLKELLEFIRLLIERYKVIYHKENKKDIKKEIGERAIDRD